jgi:hypothetical protein
MVQMKKLVTGALLGICASGAAHATGGLTCRSADTRPIELRLVIGHAAVSSIVSARLSERGSNVPVSVAQSWVDAKELRLDLVDRNGVRRELRLTARSNGRTFDGTVLRNGQRRWVRCRES